MNTSCYMLWQRWGIFLVPKTFSGPNAFSGSVQLLFSSYHIAAELHLNAKITSNPVLFAGTTLYPSSRKSAHNAFPSQQQQKINLSAKLMYLLNCKDLLQHLLNLRGPPRKRKKANPALNSRQADIL